MYITLGDLLAKFLQSAPRETIFDCGDSDLKLKIARVRLVGVYSRQGNLPANLLSEISANKNENFEDGITLYLSDETGVSNGYPETFRPNVVYVFSKPQLAENESQERMERQEFPKQPGNAFHVKPHRHPDPPVCPGILLYTDEPFADVFNRFLDLLENQEEKESREEVAEDELEALFARLLDGHKMAREELEEELIRLQGPPLHGCFWLSKLSAGSDFGMPFPMVRWNLKNRIPGLAFFSYHDEYYLLKSSKEQQSSFPTKEEQAVLDELFGNAVYYNGVSNEFFDLSDLPNACIQCEEALKLGEKFLRGQKQFYYFDEVSLHYIMQELQKSVPFSMISSPYYQVLKRYDEENRSNLTYIFLHFIKNSRNINRTAAEIFMHRNTVLNNVKKAYTVMQSECDNFPAQLAFMISYYDDMGGGFRR